MKIETAQILQQIIDKDSTIELIEVWSNVLYIRRSKGRNTFFSKKGIQETEGVYINIFNFTKNEYKRLQFKYHPDFNSKYLHISKSLNQWKDLLLRHLEGKLNRELYSVIIDSCTFDASLLTTIQSTSIEWAEAARFLHGLIQSANDPIKKAERSRWIEEDLEWRRTGIKIDPWYDSLSNAERDALPW